MGVAGASGVDGKDSVLPEVGIPITMGREHIRVQVTEQIL